MRALLLTLVVLVGVAFAVDRIGAVVAEREIAAKVAAQYELADKPDVTIEGVPFLTQAAAGRYSAIDVHVGDWRRRDVTVHELNVRLADVSASTADAIRNRTSNFVADSATATAVVPYDVVRHFAPRGVDSITHTSDGLQVKGTFTIERVRVPATIVVAVAPAPNGIRVSPISVKAAVGPAIPVSFLQQLLNFTVPLTDLPLGARINRIEHRPSGLVVTAVANQVHFSHMPNLD